MSSTESNNDVVILAAARTPQGRLNGQLASKTAVQLGSHAIKAAVERAGIDPDDVDAVIMGQVLQAGAGQNPARQAALGGGLADHVNAWTVNQVCG
ncbi:MAG: acetyl-CoA C-acyltransferase, partial [Arthrobacter sp.]|nr:acetyl-CoA C-acyltransferase [Arthrobacter sp.]